MEEGKGNFGRVTEAEKGLVEKVSRERDPVELLRRFHEVERVVVVEEDLRERVGLV